MKKRQHLDTQVVSYAIKGKWSESVEGCAISSIVANELFLVQGGDPANANLYIPLLSSRHTMGPMALELRRRDHPFNKRLSDSIIMDFGNEFPAIIEYNNLSISILINDGLADLFAGAINHLDKDTKKTLKRRFQFLLENGIQCIPLRKSDVEMAFELLSRFREKYNIKENFRNTWNDLLVMSCAMGVNEPLITEDGLLAKFASENLGVTPKKKQDFVELPFASDKTPNQKQFRESKGYINTGWRVRFSKPPGTSR